MIVWGTKRVEKKLGRVADWCPMCREVRAFLMRKVSMVGHVYFLSLGRGETVGHFAGCESCGFEMEVDPTAYAAMAKPRSKLDARQLVQSTFPNIRDAYAERLELEKRLRDGAAIEPEVREELLREVLQNAAPAVEARYSGGTQLDARTGLALLATLLAPFAILWVGEQVVGPEAAGAWAPQAAGLAFVAGLIATFAVGATANARWLRAHILPMLVRAFRPLRPSEQELDQLLAKFRAADLKIGKKLKSRLVCESLQDAQARALA